MIEQKDLTKATDKVDLDELEKKLQENKKQMLKIMQQAPVIGVYAGEDREQWQKFFTFYMDFMKAEIGPRGQCSKEVRIQMAKQPQKYDKVLSLLGVDHTYHIKDIYIKYKTFSPSPDYDQILKVKDTLEKSEDSFAKICDNSSIMYRKIKEGMLSKHGEGYDYEKQIEQIKQNYEERIKKLKQDQAELQAKLKKCQNYHRYLNLKEEMKDFFRMWKEADKRVGFESTEKGDTFQKIVRDNIIPIILKRANIDAQTRKIKIVQNCRWQPKSLGQIDVAILQFHQHKSAWEAIVLVQCKSRLFDVREAYKQVAVLQQKNKTYLQTIVGLVQIRKDYDYFIVTTLPQFPFTLPVQSKMKEVLQRSHKNKMISEIISEQIYPEIRAKMQQELSPLEFFQRGDSDRIIVWSHK